MGRANKSYFSSTDLAKMFQVSQGSIKNWVEQWEKEGKLTAVPRTAGGATGHGHRRFTQAHVDTIKALLNRSESASPIKSVETSNAGQ